MQRGGVQREDVVGVEAGRRDGRGQGAAAGGPRQQRVRRQGLLQHGQSLTLILVDSISVIGTFNRLLGVFLEY